MKYFWWLVHRGRGGGGRPLTCPSEQQSSELCLPPIAGPEDFLKVTVKIGGRGGPFLMKCELLITLPLTSKLTECELQSPYQRKPSRSLRVSCISLFFKGCCTNQHQLFYLIAELCAENVIQPRGHQPEWLCLSRKYLIWEVWKFSIRCFVNCCTHAWKISTFSYVFPCAINFLYEYAASCDKQLYIVGSNVVLYLWFALGLLRSLYTVKTGCFPWGNSLLAGFYCLCLCFIYLFCFVL